MNTLKELRDSIGVNGIAQITLSLLAVVVIAVCYSSSKSLFAVAGDYLFVLSPFELSDLGDLSYWASWIPIMLSLIFFSVVISNQLTGALAGAGTTLLFYLSAISVALSIYFKIAAMTLSYVAATTLADSSSFTELMQYGIFAMPLGIALCTFVFWQISSSSWTQDYSALSWCLYVAAMVLVGAFAPALIYLICLVALWLMFGAMFVFALVVGIPLMFMLVALGLSSNF